jgi:hypothetical protein
MGTFLERRKEYLFSNTIRILEHWHRVASHSRCSGKLADTFNIHENTLDEVIAPMKPKPLETNRQSCGSENHRGDPEHANEDGELSTTAKNIKVIPANGQSHSTHELRLHRKNQKSISPLDQPTAAPRSTIN